MNLRGKFTRNGNVTFVTSSMFHLGIDEQNFPRNRKTGFLFLPLVWHGYPSLFRSAIYKLEHFCVKLTLESQVYRQKCVGEKVHGRIARLLIGISSIRTRNLLLTTWFHAFKPSILFLSSWLRTSQGISMPFLHGFVVHPSSYWFK